MTNRVNHGVLFISAFVIAALVGPSDAHAMSVMAVSMFLLVEAGLWVGRLFLKG